MIGFSTIKKDGGRLGNQLFRYAALKGIGRLKNFEICLPPDVDFDYFNLSIMRSNFTGTPYVEKKITYDPEFVKNCPDNADIFGYFASEHYFKHIKNEIRKDLSFKDAIVSYCLPLLPSKECIALHVRRGDYLKLPNHHPVCSLDYYTNALNILNYRKYDVMIFSDDPVWCSQQHLFQDENFKIVFTSDTNYKNSIVIPDDVYNLCLMSMCKNFICANSTYSWWAAWLAENKSKVIFPKKWYGVAYSHLDNKDLLYMSDVDCQIVD